MTKRLNGTIIGYDPGGDGKHGLATLNLQNGRISTVHVQTLKTAFDVLKYILSFPDLIAIGVDTLTCWSTGQGGWRPADKWLRSTYRPVLRSVLPANSLSGSMGLNGMATLITLVKTWPSIMISETHPKVLYFALTKHKYEYDLAANRMDEFVSKSLGLIVKTNNDHEWDAAISAYASFQGVSGNWTNDLHDLPTSQIETLVMPAGSTNYWWPE